ncbi:16242_t:CDS:10 [Entrophospora sp. SA101]|nr:16242_t:CDS:10 [Entrophospora sp. SA101]
MEIDAVNSSYLQQPQEQINHLQHQPHSRINGLTSTDTIQPFKETITGLVNDSRMRFHNNILEDNHHPEDPARTARIQKILQQSGCYNKMKLIKSREATCKEVCLVHTIDHWNWLMETEKMDLEELESLTDNGNSLYVNNDTALCAKLACGGAIELCEAVANGVVTNGFANIRPPGHHAEHNCAMGFCFVNSVAVAAKCLTKLHNNMKILILDWDVHHGNGTQKAFYNDPNVLYCSLHLYEDGAFYPCDKEANFMFTGGGEAIGKTVNIPWPCNGMYDSDYIYAFNKVVMPIAYEFSPDIVIVSAGFDAAAGDPIGENNLTPLGFAHMTDMLKKLANGKIALILEGGYNLESVSKSAMACVKVLLGESPGKMEPIKPRRECLETIEQVIRVQSKHWKSLVPEYNDVNQERMPGKCIVDLAEMMKIFRKYYLFDKLKIITFPIRDDVMKSKFSETIYASPDFMSKKTVFIFIHDMADFRANTMAMTNSFEVSGSYMVDTTYQYIRSIIARGYGLIDIDLPPNMLILSILKKLSDSKLFLIGSGIGCQNLLDLIQSRETEVIDKVIGLVLIPGHTIDIASTSKKFELHHWYNKVCIT